MDQAQLQRAWARKRAWDLAKTWINTVLYAAMMGGFAAFAAQFRPRWIAISAAVFLAACVIYPVVVAVRESRRWRAGRNAPPPPDADAVLAGERRERNAALLAIALNLPVAAGVAFLGWRMHEIVLLFWIDTVLFGAFALLRLLRAEPEPPGGKLAASAFLLLFYVPFGFMLVVFLDVFFPPAGAIGGGLRLSPFAMVAGILGQPGGLLAFLVLVAGHAIAFRGYLRRGEFRAAVTAEITGPAIFRLMALMGFTVVGGFVVFHFGSNLVAAVAFVAVKILIDLAPRRNSGPG